MQKAIEAISDQLLAVGFEKCTFSSPIKKSQELRSVVLSAVSNPLEIKAELRLQKHNDIKTIVKDDFISNHLSEYLTQFKQCLVKTKSAETQILINKKLKSKIITKTTQQDDGSKAHNREKKYLLPDGEECPFLIAIGVMGSDGWVKPTHYKKFRQINRFLELVDDLYRTQELEVFHAVDFGCGKSYLTFALYHYFKNIKQVDISITGIDLKQEVINHCNKIAEELSFERLRFVHGFIHDFKTDDPVDFVVTLHACDTATDDAILFALRHEAKQMMFVPCCQHELNKQLENEESSVLLKHGIFRDRMTAIVTDTMRTQLLEACGYKVQTIEFTSLEHTAKNILLRCVKVDSDKKRSQEALQKYLGFKQQWNINPYLEKQLREEKFIESEL
tara:strand:- start:3877 stop:5046 length:1170 start_codon:yes stop_codon:yes gene_type:complete